MSCLPNWICSAPAPMQCAEVEQADEIQQRMRQIAQQYEQMSQDQQPQESKPPGMFQ